MTSEVAQGAAAKTASTYSLRYRRYVLALLFLVAVVNYMDRYIVTVVLEPIKNEFGVSDTAVGLLAGFFFVIFYATLGVPIARWADVGNRRNIIAGALALWSLMTAACGMASNFFLLAIARVGVGVGEAGATPPSHSLVGDYFPADKRAGAISALSLGGAVGGILAIVLGGYVAGTWGWRPTLILLGMPGVILALLIFFTLREPRSVFGPPTLGFKTLWEGAGPLLAKPSYRNLVAGLALYGVVTTGAVNWFLAYLQRVRGLDLKEASLEFGLTVALATPVGILLGGWLGNRITRTKPRSWLAGLPAVACALAFPAYAASAYVVSDLSLLVSLSIGGFLLGLLLPAAYASLHAVSGPHRRATAIAIAFLFLNLVGGAGGSAFIGVVSDALEGTFGDESLRWALFASFFSLLWAAVHFALAARHMNRDSLD